MATPMYKPMSQLAPLQGYNPGVQTSAINPAVAGGMNYDSLAMMADAERQASLKRAADRQNAVIGGYDQQIANSRLLGDQGYSTLAGNYDAIASDAAATRDRNMARVDQYGNSMRQDLNVKNRQALAASQQSAVKRGLGNTTITDSLTRGTNFDNTRQQLALEDQLLQNRIATDSSLSAAYQGTLQNRAQGLAAQWNQNMNNENQLTSQRLGYLGGIQDDMSGLENISNLYSQKFQMENANQQAGLERTSRSAESEIDRAWQAQQAELERLSRGQESETDRAWRAEQARIDREMQGKETAAERDLRIRQAELDRSFQSSETAAERAARESLAEKDRAFQGAESAAERSLREKQAELDRAFQGTESKAERESRILLAEKDQVFQGQQAEIERTFQKTQAEIDRTWKAEQAKIDREMQGRESAAERELRQKEAEKDRQTQISESQKQRDMQIEQAALDRSLQIKEAELERTSRETQAEFDRQAENPYWNKTPSSYSMGFSTGGGLYARPNAVPYDGIRGGY
jgi:hypothetical protein